MSKVGNVLFIDDYVSSIFVARSLSGLTGSAVDLPRDLGEAKQFLKEKKYNWIVTDPYSFANKRPNELFLEIVDMASEKNMRVAVLTSQHERVLSEVCGMPNYNLYLLKPVIMKQLYAALQKNS